MPNLSEKELLRRLEMLARLKPEAAATEQAMDKVRQNLLSGALVGTRPTPKLIQFVRQPWARTAIAAVLTFVLTVGGVIWYQSSPTGPDTVASTGAGGPAMTGSQAPTSFPMVAMLEQQRGQLAKLAKAGDVQGLTAMLSQGYPLEIRRKAAEYLSDIGGAQAIESLQRANARYIGDPQFNPFAQAITQIKSQVAATTDIVTVPRASDFAQTLAVDFPAGVDPFQAQGTLSGVVTDADTGMPVAGLTLELIGDFIHQAETDAQGQYRFDLLMEEANYHLSVASNQYRLFTQEEEVQGVALLPDSQVVRHLRVQRGCQVESYVVDESGRPVTDVQLVASWLGSERSNDVGAQATTDLSGRAVVGALAPSEIPYLITAISGAYAPQRATVKCMDPNRLEYVEVVLRRGQDVPGTVLYADGTPGANAKIIVQPNWWHSNTLPYGFPVDVDGAFVLQGMVPGSYKIYAQVGDSPDGFSYAVAQARLPLEPGEVLSVTIPESPSEAQASIQGQLIFPAAIPTEPVYVMAYSQTGSLALPQPLIPGSDQFVLDSLEPGPYTLVFNGPTIRERQVENVMAPIQDLKVALEVVETPVLHGTVVASASGEAVSAFRIGIMKKINIPGLLYQTPEQWLSFDDALGQFDITTDGPGLYQIQVVAEGYVPALLETLNTEDGQPLVIALTQGGGIQGTVQTAAGEPVAGAQVIVLNQHARGHRQSSARYTGDNMHVRTDAHGTFALSNVPEGIYSVKVTHAQYSTTLQHDIRVQEGRDTETLQLTLQPGETIEGYVYNLFGEPEAHVALLVLDAVSNGMAPDSQANVFAMTTTDENGYYRVTGLPIHLYYLQRRDVDRTLGVVSQAFMPIEGQIHRCDLGGKHLVRGQIQINDQVFARQRFLIGDPVNPLSQTFQCNGLTDSQGRFELSGIPAGTFGIYVSQTAPQRPLLKVGTFQVVDQDVDLGTLPTPFVSLGVTLADASATVWQVQLVDGDPVWGHVMAQGQSSSADESPLRMDYILPGSYTLVVQSEAGHRTLRQPLTVTSAADQVATLSVPAGTATLTGRVLEAGKSGLVLYHQESILAVQVDAIDGFYRIEGLPAGSYALGSPFLGLAAPLVTFQLAEGEEKSLDINPSQWSNPGQGLLSVLVLGPDGLPFSDAQIWLMGPEGRIDPQVRTTSEQMFVAPEGHYECYASCPGFQTQRKEVSIEANARMALHPERLLVQVRLQAP